MNMDEYQVAALINEIPLDIRVEVVIADIISSGYNATDLFIKPAGLFERRFKKDILKAEVLEFTNRQQAVFVNTSRESIYDMLPQILFHNPPGKNSKAFKGAQEMVDEYKRRVVEEGEAKKFFLIYEIEFYRQRIANAMQESKLMEAVSYSMDDDAILSYWRLPELFDNRQKGILFYLFPVFHKIRGALSYIQEVYQIILKQEVTINRADCMRTMHYDNAGLTLGNMLLSANSIVGDNYDYYYPSVIINIGPLPKNLFYDYLPGGKSLKIIEKLNEYFMPVFYETEINIETEKTTWTLQSEREESRLGYSLWL